MSLLERPSKSNSLVVLFEMMVKLKVSAQSIGISFLCAEKGGFPAG